ncbi:DUF397 domain-containing protein [Actinophytocola sp.]|uniref:DUF397 domain-containing protein n=1 Tax=Actinophytocola sp. TaxID=1872138 RepID=UPI002ED140F7
MSFGGATWRKSSFSSHNGSCVEVAWRKSSHSSHNGACVEVAFTGPAVGIRDSKNAGSGHLAVAPSAWTTFLASVKSAG